MSAPPDYILTALQLEFEELDITEEFIEVQSYVKKKRNMILKKIV